MDRRKLCWLVVMTATLTLCGSVVGQQNGLEEKTMNYGGRWWLSRSSIEQRGYINGDADCYTSELGGKLADTPAVADVQKFVNEFYVDPPHWPVPVFRVIRMSDSRHVASHEAGPPGGESWNEPHGYWDGLWWKGGTIAKLSQLGYVEGFLACYQGEAHSHKGTFSKRPAQYVSLITGWYKSTGKEDAKIADVLFKFRDNSQSSKPGSK